VKLTGNDDSGPGPVAIKRNDDSNQCVRLLILLDDNIESDLCHNRTALIIFLSFPC
jgi:hypothetical protein